MASVEKQWAAVRAQRDSAERHKAATVPQPPATAPPVLSSSLACQPVEAARLDSLVRQAGGRHGLQPSLIRAVVRRESGGWPCAVSPKGALGLMQLMPLTASFLGVSNPFEPEENIEGGVRFLKGLLDRYHGDYALALGAYNAGPARVDQAGGVPAIAETQSYVRSVLREAGLTSISLETLNLP
jgi:soluble lytic murein transglycosylase-like protein